MSTLLKFIGGLLLGGAVVTALSDDSDASTSTSGSAGGGSSGTGSDSNGQWDYLFESFWWVAGREESRNRLDDWRNIRDRWASIGWMHFSQSHSITLLMEEAYNADPTAFASAFGEYTAQFADLKWVRNVNRNQYPFQNLLVAWLGSSWGEEIQKRVAAKYYFNPTMEMMDRIRPDAGDVYRIVAASTRIFTDMSNVELAVSQYATAEDFTEAFKQIYSGQEVWHRFDRQLKNAYSMISSGRLAIS